MASTIATRRDLKRSNCISDAFFDERGLSDAAYRAITEKIGEFASYHPSSILVVMIENACGSYE